MIRLIASDIDGTLLLNGAEEIPREIFDHIRRLKQKGILFCPASGRQYASLRKLFAPVADEVPFLCENGAVVYGPGNPGPILSKTTMDRRLCMDLSRDIMALPGREALLSGVEDCYIPLVAPGADKEIDWFLGKPAVILSAPEEMPEDVINISAYCPGGTRDATRDALFPKWQRYFRCAVAGEVWLDFTMTDKGQGLGRLARALGIGMADVMAFGDNFNDVTMLERAGRPYLMASAAPELRARFSSQCRTVAEILETL